MSKWQAWSFSWLLVLSMAGTTTSDEPSAAQPNPTSKDFYWVRAWLRKGDPEDTAAQRIVSSPSVVVGGSLPGRLRAGNTVQIDGAPVETGTTFNVQVAKAIDGKVRVKFTHEVSSVASAAIEELQSQIFAVNGSKWIGEVVVKPGVKTEVLRLGKGKEQTWLELQVDDKDSAGLDVQFAPAGDAAKIHTTGMPAAKPQ